jgi:YidC/Oxa1 family membrane protein insertase
MFDLIATVLAWFYDLWPSYGMAIVFLTLTVMVILTPLTLKGTRSMMMLQQLQPEMKKLQAQYKDDRQKLNEEMMKFYKENKINPLGGCLPLLIQLPVFFVLYRVLSGLTRTGPDGTFDPDYLDPSTALYQALDQATEMRSFGMDLSESAAQAMGDGFGHAIPYLLLVLGVAATSYIQQKQVSGRNLAAQTNPQQQMLLRIMPAFFAFISLSLPAALVVYFFVSNVYRVGQQALITHAIHKPMVAQGLITTTAKEVTPAEPEPKPPAEPRGLFARLRGIPAGDGSSTGTVDEAGQPASNGKETTAKPAPKGNGSASTKPPARPSGRTTPSGQRPAGSTKRKRKRK